MPSKVRCPGCQETIEAPPELAGAEMFCPKCDTRMRLPEGPGGGAPAAPRGGTHRASDNLRRRRAQEPDHWAPERAAFNKGVLGGLAMMGIAAAWFVLGLAAGVIYFYPPILFLIGMAGLFNGAMTGNLAGRRARGRRPRRR